MRWVTMNPPKILTEARVTATKPMTFAKLRPRGPAAISPPTMITLEMALVTLINGEGRGPPPHDVIADKDCEGEDRQLEEEGRAGGHDRLGLQCQLLGQGVEAA